MKFPLPDSVNCSEIGHMVRRYRGFSIVELLVVIAIMVIVISMVLPAARGLWKAAEALKHQVHG